MSGRFANARRLSLAQWAALAEATAALGIAAPTIALVPFRRIAARVRRDTGRPAVMPADHGAQIDRVRWAVTAAARRLPWRTKCFEQGLAAQWMLRRRGIASELHYGIARARAAGLKAHVWVTSRGVPVVGEDIAADFVEMDCFAAPE